MRFVGFVRLLLFGLIGVNVGLLLIVHDGGMIC